MKQNQGEKNIIEQINIQINNAKNEVAKKYVLENKLNDLKKELHKSEEELNQLESNLRKEKRDVDKLKTLSLSNLMSTVMGNKAEKMEKEEKEYIMAKIQYDSCQSRVSSIKSSINDTTKILNSLEKYEEEYANLLKKKIELINIYGDENTKNKIIDIEEKIDSYLKEIKEINESISVGDSLIEEIAQAKKLLNSAKNWSTLDILGGDLLSSMAKHSKIDEAQFHFSRISNLTNSFNKELRDVNISGVGFSGTTKTFDIFFDNIFSDLSVDKHINQSYDKVYNLERSVESILRKLKSDKEKLNIEVTVTRNEYDEFIKNI
ncbi:hypothetical protein [[Clostridium] dakarense]|uniref:hypothetical protein n=1 Tax=Faecalimicrobium dakarense TaxID=1301100 RepID=UPI0004B7B8AE|nr:hypothetical protein [[Clostridium] dakarense]